MVVALSVDDLPEEFVERRHVLSVSGADVGQRPIEFVGVAYLYGFSVKKRLDLE